MDWRLKKALKIKVFINRLNILKILINKFKTIMITIKAIILFIISIIKMT